MGEFLCPDGRGAAPAWPAVFPDRCVLCCFVLFLCCFYAVLYCFCTVFVLFLCFFVLFLCCFLLFLYCFYVVVYCFVLFLCCFVLFLYCFYAVLYCFCTVFMLFCTVSCAETDGFDSDGATGSDVRCFFKKPKVFVFKNTKSDFNLPKVTGFC